MAHFDKAKTFVGNLSFHIDRKDDLEKSQKRKYENKIDKERTHLNYDLNYLLREDFQELSTMERYHKRLNELRENQPLVKVLREDCELSEWQLRQEKKKDDYDETQYYEYKHKEFRKDANTICFFVIQIPRDETGEYCFKTLEEQKAFFESTISFLSQKIGQENIINIQCHYDETTIHLHAQFVPSFEDKLNCKKVLNKQFLQTFHSELQTYLETDLGRNDFSVFSNDNLSNDNLEMKELKMVSKLEELEKEEIKIEERAATLLEQNILCDTFEKGKKYDELESKLHKLNNYATKKFYEQEEQIKTLKEDNKDLLKQNYNIQKSEYNLKNELTKANENNKELAKENIEIKKKLKDVVSTYNELVSEHEKALFVLEENNLSIENKHEFEL